MAQHINTNQLHPAMVNQIPMLQAAGLNLTIMSTGQQHGIPQFAQGQPGMYQIVQQAPGQLQMQNVVHQQHQLNNIHHQQLQQTNYQQPQITHQQVQQLNNHHQLNNHAQIQLQQNTQIQQQIQHQSTHQDNTNNQQASNNNNQQQATKPQHQTKAQKKKPKVNKDGMMQPKRATTAYINFTQWYRESIKKTGRTVPKIGEFGKECAGKWNSMTEEEKKPFTEVAARDRDRYRREMEIFKPARDANKPKRPGTAFMLFMVDFRKEIAGKEPEGGVAALAKLGGERWRSMTDEDKKPYVEQQNVCKVVYEQKMEDYRKLTGQPAVGGGKSSNNNASKANSTGVKSEDSNASEHLNNSMSNSNISNVDHLNNHEDLHQNHNSQSPGSTSPHNVAQQAMSPDAQSLQTVASSYSLQSQPYYTTPNSLMSATFLDQPHEDGTYSQTIEQQIHDGQNQDQNEQQVYLNGQQYQHYNWN